jgi:hypothetical protein
MADQMVKVVKQILTIYIAPSNTNRDEYLQSSISAYNTSKQASIKCSPYEALYARKASFKFFVIHIGSGTGRRCKLLYKSLIDFRDNIQKPGDNLD